MNCVTFTNIPIYKCSNSLFAGFMEIHIFDECSDILCFTHFPVLILSLRAVLPRESFPIG